VNKLRANRAQLDGVQLAVITNRLEGIARNMMNTIFRTGRSGVINTGRDCSCCILTADGELVAMSESIPVHVMGGADLVAKAMKKLHPVLRRGDAFLHNSPYDGGSHAADHSILIPVIDDDGVHHFTLFTKAHQVDCGNATPTSYAAAARDVYEEGALIFPCVKVQEDYHGFGDVERMCWLRIRVPEQWWGDHLALLGGARIGERQLLELAVELGWDTLHAHAEQWFDYSEQRMIAVIQKLPSGHVTTSSSHDPFPGIPEGIPLAVDVAIDSDEALIDVDLRKNPDCQPCGLNLTEATARSAALIGIFNSIDHTVPPNAGSFRRLRIHLRENCCAGIPRHPASCSAGTTGIMDRVANCVQRAMAELGEGMGMAEAGLVQPPSAAVLSGRNPRLGGASFVNQIVLALGGGGGSPWTDGWLTQINCASGGVPYHDSVELDELRFPIEIHEQRIIPDSEGAGTYRGAPGAYLEYGPVNCTIEAMWLSDGTVSPALGARGGSAGALASQHKREVSGDLSPLDPCARVVVDAGERIISISTGGGGYGPPSERDPERVRHDVVEGWISRERAEQVYGVVFTDATDVDSQATVARRRRMNEDARSPRSSHWMALKRSVATGVETQSSSRASPLARSAQAGLRRRVAAAHGHSPAPASR
jgi:N-methylhydantoinase B